MEKSKRKILVAVDGSDQSMACVRYAANMFSPENTRLVLFHVQSSVPEVFWDLERYPGSDARVKAFHAWAMEMKRNVERFMGRGREMALEAGFAPEDITVSVVERRAGLARDILYEAQLGYDVLVIGRTGTSQLKDLVLGSVAEKILDRLSNLSMILVGGRPETDNLLAAVDNSENAMRAVEFIGAMAAPGKKITLMHVRRGPSLFRTETEQDWVDMANKELVDVDGEMDSVIAEAARRLVMAGVPKENISGKIEKDVPSRSQALVEHARQNRIGTIVAGRRGLTRVEEFFMGRVSRKLSQLAKENALWIIA
jgi:nucleotide-binding universal stress UspA family protein